MRKCIDTVDVIERLFRIVTTANSNTIILLPLAVAESPSCMRAIGLWLQGADAVMIMTGQDAHRDSTALRCWLPALLQQDLLRFQTTPSLAGTHRSALRS